MNKSKILVVDDEKDIRESLSDILNDEGFEVFIAENAIKAKEIKNNTNLDLILLDIWMPECDGISLLKEWAINKQINCPVIMMSGHGTIDTAIEATRIGAYDFIEKPISLQKLLKKVSIALKKSIRIDGLDLSFISQGDDPLIKELRQKLSNLKKNNVICISGHEGNFTNLCIEYIVGNNFYLFDPQQKLEATIVNRIQGKGQSLILIKNYTNLTAYGIAELKNIIDVLTVNKIRVVIVDNRKNFILALLKDMEIEDHFFTLPIDNDMDLISAYSTLILNYYLLKNPNIGYKEFDTSALNKIRLNSDFLNIDNLDQFIVSAIHKSDTDIITSNDLMIETPSTQKPVENFIHAYSNNNQDLFDLNLKEARDEFEKRYFEFHIKSQTSIASLAKKSGVERTHLYRKLKQLKINLK